MVRKSTVIHNNLKTETAQPMPMTSVSQKKSIRPMKMWSLQERKCPAISEAAGMKLGGCHGKTWEKWRRANTHTPPAYGMEESVGQKEEGFLGVLTNPFFSWSSGGGGSHPTHIFKHKKTRKSQKGGGGLLPNPYLIFNQMCWPF